MLGQIVTVSGAILLLLVAFFAPNNPLLITTSMTIFTAGFAMSLGILFGDYMCVYPSIKGIASSLSNSIRLLAMSLLIALSSFLFNGTIMPVAVIVFVAGVSSLLVIYWMQKS